MTRIDRYIVAEFVRVFVICFMTFMGLFIVADFVNNLDELIRHGEHHGGLTRVLVGYYGPKIPWFFDLIGRIVVLIAAVFAITALQRNNELAALMAAGVSRWRIVKPLVVCAVVVAVLAALNRELVMPVLGPAITADIKNYAGDQREEVRAQYDHASGIFLDGKGIIASSKTIVEPRFGIPPNLAARGTRIEAKEARYVEAVKDAPSGFLFNGVRSNGSSVTGTLKQEGEVVVYHPADTDWLAEDQLFAVSHFPFEQLRAGSNWRRHASLRSLIAGARNRSLDPGADVSVTIHVRMLQPVLDLVVFFLGLPIVLSRESRNAFIAVGSCMLLVILFLVVSLGARSLGMNYLIGPSLAAWSPLLIFVPLAVLISGPLRR